MELEKIGSLPVDREKVKHVFPGLRPGVSAAVQDISMANSMKSVSPGTAASKSERNAEVAFANSLGH
jgi:hypothetical protein